MPINEQHERQKYKNRALLIVLVVIVVLFFSITLVKLGALAG